MTKLLVYFICILSLNVFAQSDHKKLDVLLKAYVSADGFVDYSKLMKKKKEVAEVINAYAVVKPENLSKNDQLAFYINLYNVHTLNKIITNYPAKSIKDLDGGKPWDLKNITLSGKKISLNDIENTIIRPIFKDARIHFGLNCGAKSCPALLNEAYVGLKVDTQLESQTKKFINNGKFNTISSTALNISKLFDWYKADFGNVHDFINKYVIAKTNKNSVISYKEYDWNLNGK